MRPIVAAACLLLSGCLWSEFSDTAAEPPVELVDRPAWVLGGYGTVLAASAGRDSLLVGGYPLLSSAALFSYTSEVPTISAACNDPRLCKLVGAPAPVSDRAGGTGCFVLGIGSAHPDLGPEVGIVGGCASGAIFKMPMPPPMRDRFSAELFQGGASSLLFPGLLTLASAGSMVAAGSPDLGEVLVYAKSDAPPGEVKAPPGADTTFGRTVALSGEGAATQLAVSAPNQGRVYIYDTDKAPVPRACVQDKAPYGVVMHGFVDAGRRLLAVSDAASRVDILDLSKLSGADCAPIPKEALVDSMVCAEDSDVSGCSDPAFGFSVTSADLDGDGATEVLIGAPGLNVRGVPNAGAIAVFELNPALNRPKHLFLSSASAEERVGTAVAAFKKDGHIVVASSALIKQKTPLFHCAEGGSSRRCQ